MMFAFGRDGLASRLLSGVSAATGVPQRALALEMLIGLALLTAFRLAGTSALNVFFYLATIGTLSLLVMYVLTNVAAARHLRPALALAGGGPGGRCAHRRFRAVSQRLAGASRAL